MVDELDETLDGPDERRLHDRSRLIVDVYFDGQDATGVASTKDISIGGFYLNTQTKLPEASCRQIALTEYGRPFVLRTEPHSEPINRTTGRQLGNENGRRPKAPSVSDRPLRISCH